MKTNLVDVHAQSFGIESEEQKTCEYNSVDNIIEATLSSPYRVDYIDQENKNDIK